MKHSKILVIDDDSSIRKLYSSVIQSMGHDVKSSSESVESLSLISDWGPDFILLDCRMPGFDLREFIPEMKLALQANGGRVLLCTSAIQNDVVELGKEFQIPYLEKPSSLKELEQIVSEGLRPN